MDRLLFLAMNGASEIMKAQAVNTNNLANASTAGFRAELTHFTSEPIQIAGTDSQVFGLSTTTSPNFEPGLMQTTGRELDVAVNGQGWFAIQAPDGTEGYTRRGDLQINSVGQLTNGAGQPVIGNGGPISLPPFSRMEIAGDGSISIQPIGQGPEAMAVIDRLKMVSVPVIEGEDKELQPRLERGVDGILRMPEGQELQADAAVTLTSGVLEGSNVNAVESMVRMIELARQFESQIKMMETSHENEQALSQVMRVG